MDRRQGQGPLPPQLTGRHGGVRFPRVVVGGLGHDGGHDQRDASRPGVLLPGREEPRPAVRRGVLHRRPHHRHLLPPILPGPHPGVRATSPSTRPRPRPRRPGFRACKRCLPDATPGSPDWDVAADAAGRAMRLIADGVVDREGVEGLAARLGYTPRHLTRLLTAGARRRSARPGPRPAGADRSGPHRDHRPGASPTSRSRPGSPASGSSTTRSARSTPPPRPQLRGRRGRGRRPAGTVRRLRLAVRDAVRRCGAARLPRDAPRRRASRPPDRGWYARTLRLPHGPGVVRLELADVRQAATAFVPATFRARRPARPRRRRRARAPAPRRRLRPGRRRRSASPATRSLAPLVRATPGPAGARARRRRRDRGPRRARAAGQRRRRRAPSPARLVSAHGEPDLGRPASTGLTHLFPDAGDAGRARPRDAADAARPRARAGRPVRARSPTATVALDRERRSGRRTRRAAGAARDRPLDRRLRRAARPRRPRRLPADRPRRAQRRCAASAATPSRRTRSERWRPWRSYALLHLWQRP